MSGFVCLYRPSGAAVDGDALEAMHERLAYRGPDGGDCRSDGSVGVGHQLLVTTPEAAYERLPAVEEDLVFTGDVRIDNRPELLGALEVGGDRSRVPDGELVLEAYREWGTACVEHLVGAFAFVVYDRARERLFCARDHLGIKPCYVHTSPERVAVASTAPAVLAAPGVGTDPDERRIGDYLAGRFRNRRRSFYEAVERVPPGHYLTASEAGVRFDRYWSVEAVEPLPPASTAAYDARFRELFERAVEARLRSPGPVGSMLSGGLDSSSIVAVAGRLRDRRDRSPLHTFSAVFEEVAQCDEREFIEAVLEGGRYDDHAVAGDRIPPLSALETVLEHRGEPYYPSLFTLPPALYESAAGRGVGVVLHGYGGDQTMGSDVRGYLRWLARRGRLLRLARELRAYKRRYPWLSARQVLLGDLARPLAPGPLRRLRHAAIDRDRYVENALASIDLEFARESGLDERLARDALVTPERSQRAIRERALAADEPPFNLELNDAVAAAHGVEPRYPYFDVRLVEFAVALPPGTTVADGLDRTIVRRALADELPRAVRERDDKAEFSANVCHGVVTYDLDRIDETLFSGTASVDPYVDLLALRSASDRLERREGWVSEARDLLMATTLEQWLQSDVNSAMDNFNR